MMTTTHILVGLGAASRKTLPNWVALPAFIGAIIPDINIAIMLLWARMTGYDGSLWREPRGLYWQEPWQGFSAVVNSFPLYALGLIVSLLILRRSENLGKVVSAIALFFAALCASAILHVALDFPVHTDDAHQHFWPLTSWRFHSAVSYYRSSQFGDYVAVFEAVVSVLLAFWIFRHYRTWPMRALVLLLLLPNLISLMPRGTMYAIFQFMGGAA